MPFQDLNNDSNALNTVMESTPFQNLLAYLHQASYNGLKLGIIIAVLAILLSIVAYNMHYNRTGHALLIGGIITLILTVIL